MYVWPGTRTDFFFDPVVLELISYRTRANRLIKKSKTTDWMAEKNWTGIKCAGRDCISTACIVAKSGDQVGEK